MKDKEIEKEAVRMLEEKGGRMEMSALLAALLISTHEKSEVIIRVLKRMRDAGKLSLEGEEPDFTAVLKRS